MARYYPILLDLNDRLCVVVGGGPVAARKTAGLLEAGARVRLVSPEIVPALRELVDQGRLDYRAEVYSKAHLSGAYLLFAATNVRSVNAQAARDAEEARIPATVADAPDEGSFVVPALVRRGELCLAVSTGGSSPMLAARLAEELERQFGPEYGDYVELLGDLRDTIKEWTNDSKARRTALAAVLTQESEILAHLAAAQPEAARELAQSAAQRALDMAKPLTPAEPTRDKGLGNH